MAPVARASGSVSPVHVTTLRLGSRTVDLEHRPLVMGILDVAPPAADGRPALDRLVRRAEALIAQGADLLDVGASGRADGAGPAAGPGTVEDEELESVVRALEALSGRFEVTLSVATSRASVARAAFGAGAVVGNDPSGFADPDYLAVAAECGATVVAGHPGPVAGPLDTGAVGVDDVVGVVRDFLVGCIGRALAAGVTADRIVVDAGLGRGKTPRQALALLRGSDQLADLGHALLLSVEDGTFADGAPGRRDDPCPGATSLGVTSLGGILGCRVVRVRDVAAHRQACAVLAAVDRVARS